jgi:hypothetical protein
MHLKELECEGADWIHMAQDWNQWWTVVNIVKNLQVIYKALNSFNAY